MKAHLIIATIALSLFSISPLVLRHASAGTNMISTDSGSNRDGSVAVWNDILSTVKQCTAPTEQGKLVSICENRIYPTDDGVLVIVGNNDTYFLDLMIRSSQSDKKMFDLSFSIHSGEIVAEQFEVDLNSQGIFEALLQ